MEKFLRNTLIAICGAGLLLGAAKAAKAQDFTVTTERTASGWETTYREWRPVDGRAKVLELAEVKPLPNACDKAGTVGFEIVNRRPGEKQCIGGRR